MKYHKFKIKNIVNVIIVEPKKNNFVWISMYLDEDLRNGFISQEVAKYLLYKLKGNHYIHWLKKLHSFNKLSNELKWNNISESNIFDNCLYANVKNIQHKPKFYNLFDKLIDYKLVHTKPSNLNFYNKKEEFKVLNIIKSLFGQN